MKVSLNSRLIPRQAARVPAIQSALYYGTGCFETLRADSCKFLHFDDHSNRLKKGIEWLGADPDDLPPPAMLREDAVKLLAENQLDQKTAKIRIQAFPNEGPGYGIAGNPPVSILITAEPYSPPEYPARVGTVSTRTIPGSSRPADLKLSNMLHYRNAYREAEKNGLDDALLLNTDGYIAETSVANVFWRKENTVYTPSAECDLLPGIMRSIVAGIVREMDGYDMKEGKYLPDELKEADEAWITNSVKELVWIEEADKRRFDTGTGFRKNLQSAFSSYKKEHLC